MGRKYALSGSCCGRIHRRRFLVDLGLGFTGLALGSMLQKDGVVRGADVAAPSSIKPKAKKIIWVFLSGGVSHLETFDPKPLLNKLAGKTYDETKLPNPMKSPLFKARSRTVTAIERTFYSTVYPLQVGHKKYGQMGMEVSDWLPNLATCVDDMAFVRSMYTTDNDHDAEFQMHHGRHKLDDKQPVIGSWIHYGLGTLNENLPQFVVLGEFRDTRVKQIFDADYLGPVHGGVHLSLDPKNPLPFGSPGKDVSVQEQQGQYAYINHLNRISAVEYPDDEQLRARIQAYELAFRMQQSVPDVVDLSKETKETQQLYGLDNPATAIYGRRCLAARRLAEKGVRFTLVYLSDYGEWDSHADLKNLHARSCGRVDKPLAGLIKDLKRRGMFEDTVVVCCTEFGRTPASEKGTGRDHHPNGFTVWLAGAGIKRGIVHGATDELGFHAVENPHYVTDIHATLLHLLGMDSHRLEIPGRKRLEIDCGAPIREILA